MASPVGSRLIAFVQVKGQRLTQGFKCSGNAPDFAQVIMHRNPNINVEAEAIRQNPDQSIARRDGGWT
ncbi:hypothetical protein D3C80_2002650 [compost metagenome]